MTLNVISFSAAISVSGGGAATAVPTHAWIDAYVFSFSAAISGSEKGGQWARALLLLENNRKRG